MKLRFVTILLMSVFLFGSSAVMAEGTDYDDLITESCTFDKDA